ncbi:DUF11 domain-containing protein [Candidatus Parcubacteria bacterium]|nr:DUF11 domain-containing protein [Candidatus Parcubacteria bacterium]
MLKTIKKINTNIIFSILAVTAIVCFSGNFGSGNFLDTKTAFGYGGTPPLKIHDQQLSCLSEASAIITWRTNKNATSRVVYGTKNQISIGAAPNYGYEFSTIKNTNKVTHHSVVIKGLIKNTAYYFKPISSASPSVLGGELAFNMADCCDPVVLGEEGEPILKITKSIAEEFANPGDTDIEYTIAVANTGNLTAFETLLTDTLPAGLNFSDQEGMVKTWSLGDIEQSGIKEISYLVDVSADAKPIVYINKAEASASNHETVSAEANLEVRAVKVLAETGFSVKDLMVLLISLSVITGFIMVLKRENS